MPIGPHPKNPVLRNFLAVGFIQGIGLILPLLTIPYLLQTLGSSGFGQVSFALAYTTFFVVFTDYGYNLWGTRKIALVKNDPQAMNTWYSTMLGAQLMLTVVAALVFGLSVLWVPVFTEFKYVFFCTFGVVIGSTLLPTWFFQGVEHFKTLHWIQLGYRLLYTLAIFLFIQNEEDLLWVPIFNSITSILGGVAGLLFLHFRYGLRFRFPSFSAIRTSLKEGWHLFISALSVTTQQQWPVLVLGFFTQQSIVGFYAFAEKIVMLLRLSIQILGSVLYPRVIAAARESYARTIALVRKVERWGLVTLLMTGIALCFTPPLLAAFDPAYRSDVLSVVLPVLAFHPLLFFFKITSQQVLLAYDLNADFARVQLAVTLIALAGIGVATYFALYLGTALSVLAIELFLIAGFRSYWKKAKALNCIR